MDESYHHYHDSDLSHHHSSSSHSDVHVHHHHHHNSRSEDGKFHYSHNHDDLSTFKPRILLAVMATVVLLSPLFLIIIFRNKALRDDVKVLRSKIDILTVELEKRELPKKDPVPTVVADDISSVFATNASDVTDTTALYADVIGADTITDAMSESIDDAAFLRDMNLAPNGMRREENQDGSEIWVTDAIAQNLANAFMFFASNQYKDAAAVFSTVVDAKPEWPYGHYYLGLASGDMEEFAKAERLLMLAHSRKIDSEESNIYLALVLLYRKANVQAEIAITRIIPHTSGNKYKFGPLYAPSYADKNLLEKLSKIPGMPEIKVLR